MKNYHLRAWKHGFARAGEQAPEYTVWCTMRARCANRHNHKWHLYGARGIKVCESWVNSFSAFLADMGMRPSPKHSIERIDNNGNYEPSNCRWATVKEQARNTRTNHFITWRGKTACFAEWAEITNIGYGNIKNRINNLGWPVKRALTEPVRFLKPRTYAKTRQQK